jgi:hypothetical protein
MDLFKARRRLTATLAVTLTAAGMAVGGTTPASAAPINDHIDFWNESLLIAFRNADDFGPPTALSRAAAMMHTAIYDTSISLGEGTTAPYIAKVAKQANVSYDYDANVDIAAYTVLKTLFPQPEVSAKLAARYAEARATPPAGNPLPGGWSTSVGEGAAYQIIGARAADGSDTKVDYQPSTTPGQWRPTGSGNAATPQWGRVKPFAIPSTTPFRPGPPAGINNVKDLLASPQYAAQVNEVQQLGALNSTKRTAEQTQIAFFWANDLKGTYKPPGQLLRHTRIVLKQFPNLSKGEESRLYALVSLAMADAAVVAWEAKYETPIDLWRPESAIQHADDDDNPATTSDLTWQPLSQKRDGTTFSPPFPAYVSGHATFAGAWAGVMRTFFGTDNVAFGATTEDPQIADGVKRQFVSFSAAATENARSRVYLGVHYQWDADAGLAAGTSLGSWVAANKLR